MRSSDPYYYRSTEDIRQTMPTCVDRVRQEATNFAWGNPWSKPNDSMTYFIPRAVATTDDLGNTMYELMSLAGDWEDGMEPCVSVPGVGWCW